MAEINDAELATLKAKAAKADSLEGEVAEFKKKDEQIKADAVKFARKNVNDTLDKAVTDGRITPAKRTSFARILRVDDDAAVVSIKADDIKELIGDEPQKTNGSRMFSKAAGVTDDGSADTDGQIDSLVREAIQKEPTLNYTRALNIVLAANPELAKAHLEV